MRLYDRFEDKRDRFQILAFHEPRMASFEELDDKLAPIVDKLWEGRALPFPILLDHTGETVERYGVTSYPATVLIDPDGNVLATDRGENQLERILEDME